ncbi:hypothetical protein I5N59_25100 [Serratia marcescens]|uniref:hypothetical protein n=1 Tax=Serratia marcescens TaxID=615 RepID=UPI0018D9565B|nr:hypothetical protein [Serratia marcescens]
MDIQTYDHFIFELRYPDSELELCSLNVNGYDLGQWLRFTTPQLLEAPSGYYKTIQVRYFRFEFFLSGWQAREVLINPRSAICRLGKWQASGPYERFDFSHLPRAGIFPRRLKALGNPPDLDRDTWYRIEFDANELHWYDCNEKKSLQWSKVICIEMHKYWTQISLSERPYMHLIFIRQDGYQQRIMAPLLKEAPLYIFLLKRFSIPSEALEEVLLSRYSCIRTLWTSLPQLQLEQHSQLDSHAMARDLQEWLLYKQHNALKIGTLLIPEAEVRTNEEPFEKYPPRAIGFMFSGINDKQDRKSILSLLERISLALGENAFNIDADFDMFFKWHGLSLSIYLSFEDGGHGHGSIRLSTPAYQEWLHDCFPVPDAPQPIQKLLPDFVVNDLNYSPTQAWHVFPRPDLSNSDYRVVFWRDGIWQGFSEGPWSIRWRIDDIVEIKLEIEDEMSDRGGPYDYLLIILADGSRFGIRSKNSIDVVSIRKFFSKNHHPT